MPFIKQQEQNGKHETKVHYKERPKKAAEARHEMEMELE